MTSTSSLRHRLDPLLAEHAHAARQVVEERVALAEAEADVTASAQAQQIVQEVAEAVQRSAHAQIASVVTRCLRAVFGEESYEFAIKFDKKRGKTEARLCFVRDGHEVDPKGAAGGGAVDVAAFALRLACLVLSSPRRRKLLVLDEPFKHLSSNYRPAITQLLTTLCEELAVQIVIVTHSKELVVGRVIEIG